MSTMYSTGPVLVWVGPQLFKPAYGAPLPAGNIRFLGTAEQTPQAEERYQQQPAYNDLSGAVPFDLNFLGGDAIFAIDLTYWDERVLAVINSQPQQMGSIPAVGGAGARGSYSALNGMGLLQAHEGNTITLYIVFPYGMPTSAPGAAMFANGMPVGYRFHGGSLISVKNHQMGSKYRKTHLTFQFAPLFDYTTNIFHLFDHSVPTNLVTPPTS